MTNLAVVDEVEQYPLYYENIEREIFTRTIWGESKTPICKLMNAFAEVILNRAEVAQQRTEPHWWGNNIIQICQKPFQFRVWNRSDPDYHRLMSAEDDMLYMAYDIVENIQAGGEHTNLVEGATHFHVDFESPYWSKRETPVAVIENYKFYNLRG